MQAEQDDAMRLINRIERACSQHQSIGFKHHPLWQKATVRTLVQAQITPIPVSALPLLCPEAACSSGPCDPH